MSQTLSHHYRVRTVYDRINCIYSSSSVKICRELKRVLVYSNKAFAQNWFNETHQLNITQDDLVELLTVATKHQLFQFSGHLYEQIDRVAMGSPLGPFMANVFM